MRGREGGGQNNTYCHGGCNGKGPWLQRRNELQEMRQFEASHSMWEIFQYLHDTASRTAAVGVELLLGVWVQI